MATKEISLNILAENFVACEFVEAGKGPLYSRQMRNAEITFLYVTVDSEIIPVEVKSGKRTKAKSLASYIERYHPDHTVKLVGKVGGTDEKIGSYHFIFSNCNSRFSNLGSPLVF